MGTTVTKKELAYRIAAKTRQKKAAVKRILQTFLGEIVRELGAGNRLEFREFGVFQIKTRAARRARNPRTGVRVDVPAKAIVHFKPGRSMKQLVNDAGGRESAVGGPGSGGTRTPSPEPSPKAEPGSLGAATAAG